MKSTIFSLCLLISRFLSAQDTALQQKIELLVNKIDSQPGTFKKCRYRLSVCGYKLTNGRVTKIIKNSDKGVEHVEEVFYLANSALVFSTETISNYFLTGDTTRWSCTYYFKNNNLIYYQSTGHGKSETDDWDPQKQVLYNFNTALAAVKRQLKNSHAANKK
jgi:hypothetical protein